MTEQAFSFGSDDVAGEFGLGNVERFGSAVGSLADPSELVEQFPLAGEAIGRAVR